MHSEYKAVHETFSSAKYEFIKCIGIHENKIYIKIK